MATNRTPTVVVLGNAAPIHEGKRAEHIQQSETSVAMQLGFDDQQFVDLTLSTGNDRVLRSIARSLPKQHRRYAIGIQHLEHIWERHSAAAAPDWIDCNDAAFAKAVAHHFGCHIGRPQALLTNAGRDALHDQHLKIGAQPAAFGYIAISASTATELATNTTLPGEITTAGGGLLRGTATYAHTVGTNTSTLTKTFTANGSDSLPVTLAKIGVFNAASSGTLGYEKLLSSTATLSVSGDNITVTWTDTGG